MKNLILACSPRAGNTDALAAYAAKIMPDSELVRLRDYRISPCDGCGACEISKDKEVSFRSDTKNESLHFDVPCAIKQNEAGRFDALRADTECETVAREAHAMSGSGDSEKMCRRAYCDGASATAEKQCADTVRRCKFADDAPVLYDKLLAAQNIVFFAPVYFCGFDAHSKAFFDRGQSLWVSGREARTKNYYLVSCGGQRTEDNFDGLVSTLKCHSFATGAQYRDGLFFRNVDAVGDLCDAHFEKLDKFLSALA